LRATDAGAASSSLDYCEQRGGRLVRTATQSFLPQLSMPLTRKYEYRCSHFALFRSDALRAIGGPYAGYRFAYDCLIMNLLLLTTEYATSTRSFIRATCAAALSPPVRRPDWVRPRASAYAPS